MLYFALALVVVTLTLLAFSEWRKLKRGSRRRTSHLQIECLRQLTLGELDEAERLLQTLLAKREPGPITHALHAQLLRKQGNYDRAKAALEIALSQHPQALILIKERGKLFLHEGRSKEALADFSRSMRLMQGAEDLSDLAAVHYQLGEVTKAWETIAPFLECSPTSEVLSLAGDCCFSRSDFSQALHYYRSAQSHGRATFQLLYRMGQCFRRQEKFADAEHCFMTILQADPKHVAATLSLGNSLEGQGLYARALAVYEACRVTDDYRILRQAGICSVHLERFKEAEYYLSEAIQLGADSAASLAYFAYTFERQQKWRGAEQVYLNLSKKHPDHVAGYRGVAWLYGVGLSITIKDEEGLKMAHTSLKLLSDPISWETLSACEARAGNFHEAHNIQEALSSQEQDRDTLLRRQRAMRTLRRGQPLSEELVARSLVA